MSRLSRRLALGLTLAAGPTFAAAPADPGPAATPALVVRPSLAEGAWLARDEPLQLELSRPLGPSDGRLAVFIGKTDVSGLFRMSEAGRLTYDAATLALPAGESELLVQLVSPGGAWSELGRFPLRVLTRRGFQKAKLTPTLEAGLKAQVAEGHAPASNVPPRDTFQDVTLVGRLVSEHQRDAFGAKTSLALFGASFRPETLRFERLGPEAPQLDLSGYAIGLGGRHVTLALGDLKHGSQRHLLEGLTTRGARLSVKLGPRLDASLAGLSATRIVGWDNLLGVGQADHRLLSGTLGIELFARPGALRLEGSLLDGTKRTQAGFGQGVVDDATDSSGLGVRVSARPFAERVRLDAGLVWSEFQNPRDPLLEQGVAAVPVVSERRGARHVDAAVDVLSNHPVTPGRPATLTLSYGHERVDPLFGSVGAPAARADQLKHALGALASLGEISLQYSHAWHEDNLDALPSILTTRTQIDTAGASLPFSALRKDQAPSPWLPVLSWTFLRTHQRGAGLPPNSDFNASHVPDQLSTAQEAALTWSGESWSVAYQHSRSDQDNRQPGRERADLQQRTHGLSVSFARTPTLTLGFEAALERASNLETSRVDTLQRVGFNLELYVKRRLGLNAQLSHTLGEDDQQLSLNRATELDLSVAYLFRPLGDPRRMQGRLFVRAATQSARTLDRTFGVDDDRDAWQLSTGLSLNLQ